MIPIWVKMAAIGIALAALGFLYWRHTSLIEENERLVIANKAAMVEIESLKHRRKAVNSAIEALQSEYAKSRYKVNQLEQKLHKHNLSRLAVAKPTMVTKRMQAGTDKILKEIENAANTTD